MPARGGGLLRAGLSSGLWVKRLLRQHEAAAVRQLADVDRAGQIEAAGCEECLKYALRAGAECGFE